MKKTLFLLLLLPLFVKSQTINTVVGNGTAGFSGDGGQATTAKIQYPARLAFDVAGNLYVATGNRIRKVSSSGIITTVAGNGSSLYSGDSGQATAAGLNPDGIAIDPIGNMYISDVGNNRIRKVLTSGIITTYAGNGVSTSGANGDGGAATDAMISGGNACALDAFGNLFVTDGNHRVRKITPLGIITTVVGNGVNGFGGDGSPATAAMISEAGGIAFDIVGNMYLTDINNMRVRKIDTNGIISTVAGIGLSGYTGDGGQATNATIAASTLGIATDNFGNLFISDRNNVIRKVSSSGIITTIAGNGIIGYAGDGGPATTGELWDNRGLGIDSCGNVYICDEQNNRIRKVSYPFCKYLDVQNEFVTNLGFAIFPNPTTSTLTITSLQPITQVIITNITGQVVCSHEYNSSQVQVDVATLPAGMYFVKVNGVEVKKFIKE